MIATLPLFRIYFLKSVAYTRDLCVTNAKELVAFNKRVKECEIKQGSIPDEQDNSL